LMFKKIAVGAATLALPLALVATPAQAGEKKGADDPTIAIKKIEAAKYGFNVKVAYTCDTEGKRTSGARSTSASPSTT
jgi:hypothetical protein